MLISYFAFVGILVPLSTIDGFLNTHIKDVHHRPAQLFMDGQRLFKKDALFQAYFRSPTKFEKSRSKISILVGSDKQSLTGSKALLLSDPFAVTIENIQDHATFTKYLKLCAHHKVYLTAADLRMLVKRLTDHVHFMSAG